MARRSRTSRGAVLCESPTTNSSMPKACRMPGPLAPQPVAKCVSGEHAERADKTDHGPDRPSAPTPAGGGTEPEQGRVAEPDAERHGVRRRDPATGGASGVDESRDHRR